jgi:hypothetical protein
VNCPICGRFAPAGSSRCTACGADFRDPDVRALARQPAAPVAAPPDLEAGGLGNDRILLLSGAGVADGTAVRRLALLGAGLLLVGALLPVGVPGLGMRLPLTMLDDGPALAILLPLVFGAIVLGAGLAGLRRVSAIALAAMMAVAGLGTLLFGLTPWGEHAETARALPVLVWLGVVLAAIGVCVRVLRATDGLAPWAIAAGGLLLLAGGLVPHDDLMQLLPLEFAALSRRGDGMDDTLFAVALDAVTAGSLLVVLGAVYLLPILAVPAAALLAARRPQGPWDPSGNALRVIGAVIVLWLPLTYGAAAFNLLGPGIWYRGGEDALQALILGRVRLTLLAAGAMLWIAGGGAALYLLARPRPGVTARSTRTA